MTNESFDDVKEIIPVALGFLLALVLIYLDRRRRARAHWAALSAEAEAVAGHWTHAVPRDRLLGLWPMRDRGQR